MSEIYRGMSQEALDAQYNARGTVADFPGEMARYRRLSDQSYAACTVQRDLAYGPSEDERIDFFPAKDTAGPVFVFVHGGYWRFLGRRDSALMAENFVRHGISVVVVEYSLAPKASLDTIVQQVRQSVAYIYQQADTLGVDKSRIYIAGSSAGAHLCAMVLATEWAAQFGVTENPVRGALLVSGLYDLEPVRLCEPNSWLHLDDASVARNSPVHNLPRAPQDILITWGGFETDEFKRQSTQYATALQMAGFSALSFEIADRNHFDIVTDLCDPSRQLFKNVVAMMSV